ncbi:base non specific RNase Rh [Conidiobolus coronatus NRRL 28638]|uniref:ribonuclease T2 n=1 Tax=Conidiobolus coronatus (strain ATCC 28846 / CBS 209.66 / NRRL 28638) TaxID=796925 RepID=A0A137P942_CONC2|nr:base non specific RNase Rh [Conidiobolus coronatus NRRL 28638]|eukprot:KXN71523.1 base non specific RNase Rh [Conidiobolus coronatus NRRL 28638]
MNFKFLTALLASQSVAAFAGCPNVLSCTQSVDSCCSPKMGVLVLALQWIEDSGPSDQWTLHGLWPNNCDGSHGPSDGCDDDRNYDNMAQIVAQDRALESQMNEYWSSYKGDNPAFWSHEWNKHGTCLSTVEPKCYTNYQTGMEVRDYFKQALALRKQFNLYKILSDNGVKPGRTYSKQQITDAIRDGLGKQATLVCKGKALQEVRIELKVQGKNDYKPIDVKNVGSCPKSGIQYNPK